MTKEKIIKVATKKFLKKQYKEVTISEIIDEVGIAKGSFYHYYKSKQELYVDVITNILELMKRSDFDTTDLTFAEFLLEYQVYAQSVYAKMLSTLEFDNEDIRSDIMMLLKTAGRQCPELRELIDTYMEEEKNLWIEVITTAQENEISSEINPEVLAELFISIIKGYTIRNRETKSIELIKKNLDLLLLQQYSLIKREK